jgi:F-type H+-transporting ATPase subunit a|tara:strand:- start:903 stop:1682 length:780 start_codon:yes stop_codon:yes gene_type:complete
VAADQAQGGFPVDPIHQFQIQTLIPLDFGGIDASFTNSSLWMVITMFAVTAFTIFAMRGRAMVPGRMQSIVEMSYEFVANMVRENAGSDGQKFFPFIFTLFMFVLFANLFGMFPYAFTVMSHIIVTFALAMTVFIGVTLVGFAKNGLGFLKLFVPDGAPGALLPLVVLIEIISYLSRPISLSVRLFANLLAGHITLKIFAGFIITFVSTGSVLGIAGAILPMGMIVALTALEFLVAFLQAYVFTVLTCMYLSDALHPGH